MGKGFSQIMTPEVMKDEYIPISKEDINHESCHPDLR